MLGDFLINCLIALVKSFSVRRKGLVGFPITPEIPAIDIPSTLAISPC